MLSNELLGYAKSLGFGELYFKVDQKSQLCAIIAIHSTKLGPALGGCRFIPYSSIDLAIHDALRLAQGMSYKAALADLPLGGGKAVLIRPEKVLNRNACFQELGRFVNNLKGRYIIAMDSGVFVEDMDAIALQTPYVVTTSRHKGNPAPYTALGVLMGIKAAVQFKLNRDDLKGLHVAIQGMGHVGLALAHSLKKKGVRLTVCDNNNIGTPCFYEELQADVVPHHAIYDVPCDVFSPCALGGILNDVSIPRLKAKIVAGAANNQLAEPRHANLLQEKDILYAPDYVINAGGLIYAYEEYKSRLDVECKRHLNLDRKSVVRRISKIYDTLLEIFRLAEKDNKLPSVVTDSLAGSRLM